MRQLLVAGLVSALLVPASAHADEVRSSTLTLAPIKLVKKSFELLVEHEFDDRISLSGLVGFALTPDGRLPLTLGGQAMYRFWGDDFDQGLRVGLEPSVVFGGPPVGSLFFTDADGLHLRALVSFKTTARFGVVVKAELGPELFARRDGRFTTFESILGRLHVGWAF